ncbi:MAG: hypothetical protein ABIE22_04485 [archaeon]
MGEVDEKVCEEAVKMGTKQKKARKKKSKPAGYVFLIKNYKAGAEQMWEAYHTWKNQDFISDKKFKEFREKSKPVSKAAALEYFRSVLKHLNTLYKLEETRSFLRLMKIRRKIKQTQKILDSYEEHYDDIVKVAYKGERKHPKLSLLKKISLSLISFIVFLLGITMVARNLTGSMISPLFGLADSLVALLFVVLGFYGIYYCVLKPMKIFKVEFLK